MAAVAQRALSPVLTRVACRPAFSISTLVLTDILSTLLALIAGIFIRVQIGFLQRDVAVSMYLHLWPLVSALLVLNLLLGLYPGIGLVPVDELRKCLQSTAIFYVALAALTFFIRDAKDWSRGIIILAPIFTAILMPLSRLVARHYLSRYAWWGVGVVVLGAGEAGSELIRNLRRNPELGLKPVAVLDDNCAPGSPVEGVLCMGGLALSPILAADFGVEYAVVTMQDVSRSYLEMVLREQTRHFCHVLILPTLLRQTRAETCGIGNIFAMDITQRLLMPGARLSKRAMDLVGAISASLLLLPVLLAVALAVKITSSGPLLFGQLRIGRGQKRFVAWKFRTMIQNAEQVLFECLRQNPELREEWERDHKLRRDPRLTPVGHFLRRFSLDELPQLWNVIQGSMSLVGPRPIVEAEVSKYSHWFDSYTRVTPGLTGMWQVSGRNDTTYAERVSLDHYYVQNWSFWLDLYILLRTLKAVWAGSGAY